MLLGVTLVAQRSRALYPWKDDCPLHCSVSVRRRNVCAADSIASLECTAVNLAGTPVAELVVGDRVAPNANGRTDAATSWRNSSISVVSFLAMDAVSMVVYTWAWKDSRSCVWGVSSFTWSQPSSP